MRRCASVALLPASALSGASSLALSANRGTVRSGRNLNLFRTTRRPNRRQTTGPGREQDTRCPSGRRTTVRRRSLPNHLVTTCLWVYGLLEPRDRPLCFEDETSMVRLRLWCSRIPESLRDCTGNAVRPHERLSVDDQSEHDEMPVLEAQALISRRRETKCSVVPVANR